MFRTLALSGLIALLLPLPGRAEMVQEYPGVLKGVTPGWFCQAMPDGSREDLEGTGQVNLYQRPFKFVEETDRIVARSGIGIGVVAQLGPFGRDDIYTARVRRDADKEQRWLTRVRPDGLVWLGYVGPTAETLAPGHWRFSLWRGPVEAFAYEITVDPPDPEAPNPCAAAVS